MTNSSLGAVQSPDETQDHVDTPRPNSVQVESDTPFSDDGTAQTCHRGYETRHKNASLGPLCDTLRELHRQRQDLHRAEKSLTLQIKAKCRRLAGGSVEEADKVYKSMLNGCEHDLALYAMSTSAPFISARELIGKERKTVEKQMEKTVKQLPVFEWTNEIHGFGVLGLALIVGEAGDLSNYSTVSKLWKRMGLAVINGQRQRRVSGPDAIEQGYNPVRRSIVWTIGDSLLKKKNAYYNLYMARKAYEFHAALERGLTPATENKATVKSWLDKGLPELTKVTKITDSHISASHINNRAKRYAEKRLLRDLWRAWRDCALAGHAINEDH